MKLAVKGLMVAVWLGMILASAQISKFQHIVVVFQENRTPDNLFQGLCSPPYGSRASCSTSPTTSQYNIQVGSWLDKTSPGGVNQPTTVKLANAYDLSHAHSAFEAMCDSGTTAVV
jgi:phospholipase C